MENILDNIEENKKPLTNFKKWSFRLFIYAIIANLVIAYKIANFVSLIHDEEALSRDLIILSIVIIICLTIGSVLTFLSYKNKEEKNYQYYTSIWGYPILIALTILTNLI